VIEHLDMLNDEITAYLNKQTGELVVLSTEELSAAEEGEDPADYPEWQQEAVLKAQEVIASDDWLELPDKFDIHEYNVMEEFCYSVADTQISERLLGQIRGSGAFRRFREAIDFFGIEQDWYRFRSETMERIAVEWLEANQIAYSRDPND